MSFIEASNGAKLAYTLSVNDPDSSDLCILVHGTCTTKDDLFLPHLADNLTMNTLRFDHQGNGESEGEFKIGGFQRDVSDIHDVVVWARANGYKPVAIVGHSKGGNNVLLYDAVHGDVPLVACVSARLNMSLLPTVLQPLEEEVYATGSAVLTLGHKEFTITKEGLEERRNLKSRTAVENGKNWVCVVHGDNDPMTPVEDYEEICRLLGMRCFDKHLIPNGGHFIHEGHLELGQVIQEFFDKARPLLKLTNKA